MPDTFKQEATSTTFEKSTIDSEPAILSIAGLYEVLSTIDRIRYHHSVLWKDFMRLNRQATGHFAVQGCAHAEPTQP